VGWGEPVDDKLDADIAYAMMGINAVKGVEIGAGFACVAQKGTEHGDEMTPEGFLSNQAGGVLGGISTGQDVVVQRRHQAHVEHRASTRRSIDKAGEPVVVKTFGRHDPCVGIRATPIAEVHARDRPDGSRPAASRPERRCGVHDTKNCRSGPARAAGSAFTPVQELIAVNFSRAAAA
jgi:hypothetical protein